MIALVALFLMATTASSGYAQTTEAPHLHHLPGAPHDKELSDVTKTCVENPITDKPVTLPITLYVQKFDPKIHNINGVEIDPKERDAIVEGVQIAIDTWNKALGKQLLNYGGILPKKGPKSASEALSDDNFVVYSKSDWVDSFMKKPIDIIANALVYDDCAGENIIAGDIFLNTQTYYFIDAQKMPNRPNKEKPLKNGRRFVDAATTLTHEIGHVLGLDHIPVERCPDCMMNPTVEIDRGGDYRPKRELSQADIDDISELYGDAGRGHDPSERVKPEVAQRQRAGSDAEYASPTTLSRRKAPKPVPPAPPQVDPFEGRDDLDRITDTERTQLEEWAHASPSKTNIVAPSSAKPTYNYQRVPAGKIAPAQRPYSGGAHAPPAPSERSPLDIDL